MGRTYRIGEAARLLELKNYVLRFWEEEFDQLSPRRTAKGQRLYSEEDIETLRTIKRLLHQEGMTIDGAKKKLSEGGSGADGDILSDVIDELEDIRKLLLPKWPEP